MRFSRCFLSFAIIASLGAVGAGASPGLWLDHAAPTNWNSPGSAVPRAPAWSGDGKKIAGRRDPELVAGGRCASEVREPVRAQDRAVYGKGWSLFSPSATGYLDVGGNGQLSIVMGTTDADGMCRPADYQVFVFRDGRYAGSLSPTLMTSRSDGSFITAHVAPDGTLRVDFARYSDADALCCPHATTHVTYAVRNVRGRFAVAPVSAVTTKNS